MRRARGRTTHRGVTLIEVVLSVTLLALLAASLTSAMAFMRKATERHAVLRGAYELANRLMVQHVFNTAQLAEENGGVALPSEGLPIAYGDPTRPSTIRRYRWSLDESPVTVRPAVPEGGRAGEAYRITQFTVRVWLGEEDGGTVMFDPDTPHAVISRMYDVLNLGRNLNSAEQLQTEGSTRQELLERIMRRNQTLEPASGGR